MLPSYRKCVLLMRVADSLGGGGSLKLKSGSREEFVYGRLNYIRGIIASLPIG